MLGYEKIIMEQECSKMLLSSMQWNNIAVTVKRLHKDPPNGGKVDLLINECETIR